ncbi:hypothetical protein EYZ11_013506 [Aspergillus tanneri]|uniref:Uncharacterized protein n=1 Tax=Aspergillus tanneri TaxID=1220188 RepID=A0A4S3IZN0_9EURO|nr:hypothetical protein EYZ11_013506 [Aspergillus tanneri]
MALHSILEVAQASRDSLAVRMMFVITAVAP